MSERLMTVGTVRGWTEPDGTRPPNAQLAAGTEVMEVERRGSWVRVATPDGRALWVDELGVAPIRSSFEVAPPASPAPRLPQAPEPSGQAGQVLAAPSRIRPPAWLWGLVVIAVAAGAASVVTLLLRSDESTPSTGRITFSSDRDGDDEIYVMAADGTGVTRLTTSAGADMDPAWSPDGSRIAFVSDRDGGEIGAIYVMAADGTGVTRLGASTGMASSPAWSPDGSRLAFASRRDGEDEIYVMAADGAGVTRLTTSPGDDRYPAWSHRTAPASRSPRIATAGGRCTR